MDYQGHTGVGNIASQQITHYDKQKPAWSKPIQVTSYSIQLFYVFHSTHLAAIASS